MSQQTIHDYIKQQRAANVTDAVIKQAMVGAGWNESDVVIALHPDTHYPDTYNSKLLGPVELLKRSWKIFTERIWTIVGIQLMPLLIMLAVSLVVLIGVVLATVLGEESHTALIVIGAIVGVVAFGFLIYISLWSQVAVIIAIRDSAEKIGVKESLNRAKGKLGAFFGAGLLAGLAVLGGYLLFIVPGIIFAIWFMFAGYIAVDTGQGGSSALSQSREHAKGLWWEIAARLMFLTLISMALNSVPYLFSPLGELATGIFSILIGIGLFLIGPVFYIYPFELYRNIKTLKVSGVQVITDKGKLFLLVACEIVLFILLYGLTFFLEVNPQLQEQLQKIENNSPREGDMTPSSSGFFSPVDALSQARDSARKADLNAISTALRLYYVENFELPISLGELVPTYIAEIPLDPMTSEQYSYRPSTNGSFEVCAEFETKTPAEKCVSDKNGQVQGAYSVASPPNRITNLLPVSPDFRLFLQLVERLNK